MSARLQNCPFSHLCISAMPVLPGISTKMLLQSWKWKSDAKHPSHAPTQKPLKTPTAYLVTLTVSLAYWIFSHHAAYGALSSAPSSTCMGSPPPSTYLEGLSMDGFSCPKNPSFSHRILVQAATATSAQMSHYVPCRMWGWLLSKCSCPCTH